MKNYILFVLTLVALVFTYTAANAANEIIVHEYPGPTLTVNSYPVPIYPPVVTTQYLDKAELSAAFNAATKMIRLCNEDTATITYLTNSTAPSAAVATAGNSILGAGKCIDLTVDGGQKVDTAQ